MCYISCGLHLPNGWKNARMRRVHFAPWFLTSGHPELLSFDLRFPQPIVRETVRISGMLHGIQCLCHQAIQDQPAAVDDQHITAGFLWIVGAADLEYHVRQLFKQSNFMQFQYTLQNQTAEVGNQARRGTTDEPERWLQGHKLPIITSIISSNTTTIKATTSKISKASTTRPKQDSKHHYSPVQQDL